MDSHMFNTVGDEWMEFNIRTAVRTWKDFGRNYGLVVTVEDEDGVLLPAEKYVHAMNCSKDAGILLNPIDSRGWAKEMRSSNAINSNKNFF